MSATAPTPAAPAQPGPASSPWRVVLIVLGGIAALIGVLLLIGGAVLMGAHLTQRDDDGYLTSPVEQVASAGYAVTAEGIDLADLDEAGDWLVDNGLGRVRIEATARLGAVFVGIAPEDQVDRYPAGVRHDELLEIERGDNRYRERPGGAPRVPPERTGIWAASAAGDGTQTVDWEAENGRWAVVVMNADGSRPVAADVTVGAKLGIVPWIAAALLLAGLVAAAAGAGMIGAGVRRPRQPSAGYGADVRKTTDGDGGAGAQT